ncbi:MAG: asparagine synthase (glutamine-hydrolyzing) [Candidatus Kapaibacteriales bacterium]
MCGIVGILTSKPLRYEILSEETLRKMTETILHRGPDSNGIWISKNKECGFGFSRLAIIDLSPLANQPMVTIDGELAIIFNGEIYNYLEIRNELILKGYKFRSRSDTEAILLGYKEWGEKIIPKLSGMFVFAIWDEKNKKLVCARDRIGKKPFYFYLSSDFIIFSSEIKALLVHPKIEKKVNLSQIPFYLNFGTSSNRETLFTGIRKLPAGHMFVYELDGKVKIERYWHPFSQVGKYNSITFEEASIELLRLLRDSVSIRMMSDVPFGVFLSGGIDSSLNVALMTELMDRPVDTFTVGFKDLEKYNELEYAKKISKLFNTNHKTILIDDQDAFEVLEKLVWHEDEPNADPVCVPLYFLSKLTRDSGTIVVQVGEGSDEQFVGYNWLLRDYNFYKKIWKKYSFIPLPFKKILYNSVKPFFEGFGKFLELEILRRGTYNEPYYWSGTPIIPVSQMFKLLKREYHNYIHLPIEYVRTIYSEANNLTNDIDFLRWELFIEITHRLPELLLMRVDKIGMANSIEARVPFLDYRIVEFSMALPEHIKVPNSKVPKALLKKAAENILPNEIVYRKKQGFWAPVNEWLRYQWFDYTKSKILNSKLFLRIFQTNEIEKLLHFHKNGSRHLGFQIFTLLQLALWYDVFFNNEELNEELKY